MANEKKATVRDIAKQAGVSVATVSYVLNDKEGTKISDATRKKVLQVANLLNYSIPDKYKNINARKSNCTIGIIYSLKPDTPGRNMDIMSFINLLAERFFRIGFNCQIIPLYSEDEYQKPIEGLDGIIAIDLEKRIFKQMSVQYFIPILCLDMMINDFLFYQIYTDMESIVSKAKETLGDDFCLVTDKYSNEGFSKYISSVLPKGKTFIYSDMTKKDFDKLAGKKILAFGLHLGLLLKQSVDNADIAIASYDELADIHYDLEKKANLAMNIMMNAIERKFDITHEYKVF